jgi:anti-sigma-K factor RskA
MPSRDELEALLPFYLNGTLSGADLEAVEEWLAADAEAMAALAEAEMEAAGTSAANEAVRPPADALARFNRALEREAGPARAASGNPFAALWQRLAGLPVGLAWATAALAIALVLYQAVYGGFGQRGEFEIAGTEQDEAKRPFALVVFKADARMADIGAFLAANGAAIVGGPTATGVFRIAVPGETGAEYDRLVALIATQPFVDSVTPGRRPADAN